ncbi:MAG TPA: hypothetical protein HPP56_03170 [Nitrospirae bacterium]|nr:hypothetical protein [Nitrospirota bacterium]
MKVFQFIVIISIFLFYVISCSSSAVRYTSEEIKQFPPEVQQRIIRGEISTGMTPQQVRYAWSAPRGVQSLQGKDKKYIEQWTYSYLGACPIELTFQDGKLQSIILSDSGRTSEIRYTQEEIKGYPENIQNHIKNGQLITGMTPHQVRNSWGGPEGVSSSKQSDGKSREEWVYASTALCKVNVIFIDGKLAGLIRAEGIGSQ